MFAQIFLKTYITEA